MIFQDAPEDPGRESPGQKLEAVARGDGLDWTHATVRRDNELGLLDKISVGVYVAYTVHEDKRAAPRQYRIGIRESDDGWPCRNARGVPQTFADNAYAQAKSGMDASLLGWGCP